MTSESMSRPLVPAQDFGVTAREIDVVRAHVATLELGLGDITERYYAHLAGTDIGPFLTPELVDRLKPARHDHWRALLRAEFAALQDDYSRDIVRRIVENGIPTSVFVIAANWFAVEFSRLVDRSSTIPRTLRNELRIALTRFAFYDLALAEAAREVVFLD